MKVQVSLGDMGKWRTEYEYEEVLARRLEAIAHRLREGSFAEVKATLAAGGVDQIEEVNTSGAGDYAVYGTDDDGSERKFATIYGAESPEAAREQAVSQGFSAVAITTISLVRG